jgi:hypothetical protein
MAAEMGGDSAGRQPLPSRGSPPCAILHADGKAHGGRQVIHDLIGHGGTAYYCHTKNRMPMCDVDFLAGLAALNLECCEVREAGVATPPPSPPFFETLFPEMRMAVLKITRAQGEGMSDYCRPTFTAPDEQVDD